MPSTYAHYVFGKRMLELFPEDVAAVVRADRQLYDIGLHGPDILFYYHVLTNNKVNAVGFGTHARPAKEFFAPAKAAVEKGANAGNIVRQVAAVAGGKGGGRPDSAMAGGKDPSKTEEALHAAYAIVEEMTK